MRGLGEIVAMNRKKKGRFNRIRCFCGEVLFYRASLNGTEAYCTYCGAPRRGAHLPPLPHPLPPRRCRLCDYALKDWQLQYCERCE